MERLASWGWRRLGSGYFKVYVAFEVLSALTITISTLGLLTLYEHVTFGEFVRIGLFACACVAVSLAVGMRKVLPKAAPLRRWVRDGRGREHAPEAWRSAISLPVEFVTRAAWLPVVLVALPVSIFVTVELNLPAYSELFLFAGTLVAIAYAAVLHFFAAEMALRPVVHDIALKLPPEFSRAVGKPTPKFARTLWRRSFAAYSE